MKFDGMFERFADVVDRAADRLHVSSVLVERMYRDGMMELRMTRDAEGFVEQLVLVPGLDLETAKAACRALTVVQIANVRHMLENKGWV